MMRHKTTRRLPTRDQIELDALAVAVSGSVFFSTVSIGQSLQWALGVNTGRPAVAAAATLATLVSGLALSWEAGDALCACSLRCARALRRARVSALEGLQDHVGIDLEAASKATAKWASQLLWVRLPGNVVSEAWATRPPLPAWAADVLPAPWLASPASSRWGQGSGLWRSSGEDAQHWRDLGERYRPMACATIVGLLLFAGLGGRSLSLSPSNACHLGAFARSKASLPATLEYATSGERGALAALGAKFGCHTCGAASVVRRGVQAAAGGKGPGLFFNRGSDGPAWIADHMPPIKYVVASNKALWRRLTGWKVTQRFFPQCSDCSSVQAAAVRALSSPSVVTHHAFGAASRPGSSLLGTLRAYHLTGGLLVAGAVATDYTASAVAPAARRN